MISKIQLDRVHNYMMDVWTWDFAYDQWNAAAIEETLFWYAASGQAVSHADTTERWWNLIRRGRVREITAAPARKRWADIQRIAPKVRALDSRSALGWFLNGHTRAAWELLQDIKYVGPKIASWLLRDLSFLRDYATEIGDVKVKYSYPERRRDPAWFRDLTVQEQAFFLPLDRWVVRGAQKYGIIPNSLSLARIQGHGEQTLEVATAITSWARRHNLEPRDLDVYWYLTGSGSLRQDGLCPVAKGDHVWWSYEGPDRVNLEQDWLEGQVLNSTLKKAAVRTTGQLRDPKTRAPIPDQIISIAREDLRIDD